MRYLPGRYRREGPHTQTSVARMSAAISGACFFRYSPASHYAHAGYVGSFVPIDALPALVTFLRLNRKRGNWPRFEPLERDRFASLVAIAVSAIIQSRQRRIDLGDELTLAIAGAQLDRTVGFRRRPIGEVGMVLVLGLEMSQRFLCLLQDFLLPGEQLLAEI